MENLHESFKREAKLENSSFHLDYIDIYMEVAVELEEDDLFFADLSKQISLLIMDEDEEPLASCPPHSLQCFSRAIHPSPPQPAFFYGEALQVQSKGTGVFIPQSTQSRRKHRKGRSNSYAKHQQQSQDTRWVSQDPIKSSSNPGNVLGNNYGHHAGQGRTVAALPQSFFRYFFVIFCLKMESREPKFPPQSQETQPGKEHVMKPLPQTISPDYKPASKLQGKVALVTGGDSGIGRAVCLSFAKEGATVAFTYVKGHEDKDKDDTLKMLLEAKTGGAQDPLAIAADIGYEENCKQVIELVVKEYGRIDVLVNNAAEQHLTNSPEEITEHQLLRVFRTNIFSHFFLVRHALKHMKEGSSIINSTSVNPYSGNPESLDYTATKGAIVAFTRGLSQQLVSKGIRVNAVAPGPVWTPIQPATKPAEMIQNLGSEVPMKRAGQPSEIAPCYVFLASLPDSSYYTGQVLHPNGGMIINA
ncbi:hypothetical protein RIF29_08170 [Crotalaria pallida]|uniref:Uncharacterized protein n=1 Tax=Crotalaria pallida TaxID=3830 RepID=A0AAN9J517_CROPI